MAFLLSSTVVAFPVVPYTPLPFIIRSYDAFLWWFSPPPLACRSRKRAEKALGAAGADDAAEMYRNQVICLKVPPPFGAIGGNREMRTKKMVKYENAAQRPNKCTVHFWTTMPYALWSFF